MLVRSAGLWLIPLMPAGTAKIAWKVPGRGARICARHDLRHFMRMRSVPVVPVSHSFGEGRDQFGVHPAYRRFVHTRRYRADIHFIRGIARISFFNCSGKFAKYRGVRMPAIDL